MRYIITVLAALLFSSVALVSGVPIIGFRPSLDPPVHIAPKMPNIHETLPKVNFPPKTVGIPGRTLPNGPPLRNGTPPPNGPPLRNGTPPPNRLNPGTVHTSSVLNPGFPAPTGI